MTLLEHNIFSKIIKISGLNLQDTNKKMNQHKLAGFFRIFQKINVTIILHINTYSLNITSFTYSS